MAKGGLLRFLAAGAVLAALAVPSGLAATPASDHARAEAALSNIRAAVAAIMDAENDATNGPARYVQAAHRAINLLVGRGDSAFDPAAGDPGDPVGAIGEVNHLLDRRATPPFVPALHGVLVNLQSAVANLGDAAKAHGLGAYQNDVSQALQTMEIAEGRSGTFDVFGGMRGAIANTELGVPAGAPTENGCAAPHVAGYGLWHGWLVWHAVKLDGGPIATAGSSIVKKEGSMLVLYTPAAAMVHHLCAADVKHHAATHASVQHASVQVTKAPAARLIRVADKGGDGAVSYTMAQATAGKTVYSTHCASCHGANLQGVAAPAIAGKEFLTTAHTNGYSVSILNTIVTQNMPFNDPGSLKPGEYADVMAYLLTSNCFPAGKTAFPTNPGSHFGTVKLSIPAHPAGTPDKNGVCPVK